MEDKKLIYQIIGLDSNFKYFYLVIISFLAFLDFLFSFLFSYQKPFLLVLKYNILILYFILAVIFPKLIPTSFKKYKFLPTDPHRSAVLNNQYPTNIEGAEHRNIYRL